MNLTPKGFQEILDKFDRVALTGAIKSGKTLLLDGTDAGRGVHHTDELRRNYSFDDAPDLMRLALLDVPRYVVTGMLVPHALEAGLPVDVVVFIGQSRDPESGRSDGLEEMVMAWAKQNPEVPVYFVERALHEGEDG